MESIDAMSIDSPKISVRNIMHIETSIMFTCDYMDIENEIVDMEIDNMYIITPRQTKSENTLSTMETQSVFPLRKTHSDGSVFSQLSFQPQQSVNIDDVIVVEHQVEENSELLIDRWSYQLLEQFGLNFESSVKIYDTQNVLRNMLQAISYHNHREVSSKFASLAELDIVMDKIRDLLISSEETTIIFVMKYFGMTGLKLKLSEHVIKTIQQWAIDNITNSRNETIDLKIVVAKTEVDVDKNEQDDYIAYMLSSALVKLTGRESNIVTLDNYRWVDQCENGGMPPLGFLLYKYNGLEWEILQASTEETSMQFLIGLSDHFGITYTKFAYNGETDEMQYTSDRHTYSLLLSERHIHPELFDEGQYNTFVYIPDTIREQEYIRQLDILDKLHNQLEYLSRHYGENDRQYIIAAQTIDNLVAEIRC